MPQSSDSTRKILEHLARFGVRDKDAAMAAKHSPHGPSKARKKRENNRVTLDLHGMTVVFALSALREVIDECADKGVRELLVIHGHGLHSKPGEGAVLKTAARHYLEGRNDERIRSFTTAAPKEGGEGATIVRFF
jgi:DNA-nicking Smr family endonuclease